MPSYRDVLRLVDEGKSGQEIQAALGVRPAALRRMLSRKRLRTALAARRDISAHVASQRLEGMLDRLVERCVQIVEADSDEPARKAALAMIQFVQKQRAARELPKPVGELNRVAFMEELSRAGVLPSYYLDTDEETGEYAFEECIRTGKPIDVDYRKVEFLDDDSLDDEMAELYPDAYDDFREEFEDTIKERKLRKKLPDIPKDRPDIREYTQRQIAELVKKRKERQEERRQQEREWPEEPDGQGKNQ